MAKKGLRNREMGYGRNDLCPCGSGLKYKKCCKPVPRMKTNEELQDDIEKRQKSKNMRMSSIVQFAQAMARTSMSDKMRINYGDLPERVKVDDR